jgi:2-oxoglutarate dehydrogenase E2 component (dihydrolipoamide succinyltransferase)
MASTANIVMPLEQEGSKSVVRVWLKRIGEPVKRDEPIVELETDKVAVEVPAPEDGVLASISLNEGDEAAPGATLGVLALGAVATTAKHRLPAGKAATSVAGEIERPAESRRYAIGGETRLSPLVKRLLSEHRVSAADIAGTGRDGRITHKDVEEFIARGKPTPVAKPSAPAPSLKGGRIPHDIMRRAIAEHMSRSVAVAPHVTAVFQADFSAIIAHRNKHKDAYAKASAPLTFSAYIMRAAAEAMPCRRTSTPAGTTISSKCSRTPTSAWAWRSAIRASSFPVIRAAQALSLKETAAQLAISPSVRARTS